MSTDEDWRAPGAPVAPSPVLGEAISRVASAFDGLLAVSPSSLSDDDVARLVDFATTCVDRSAGAVTAAIGEADHRRIGESIGARHTGQWWARRSLLTRSEANRLTHLGRRLSVELYAPVQAELADGGLHVDQAWVIVKAVDAIPSAHRDVKPRAVAHLLVAAKDHDAKALKVLGRRILDIVAPEVGEAAEAKALADEETAAACKVSLTLRDLPDGTTTGKFTVPTAGAGEMLRKHLMAIAAPKHQNATAEPDQTPDRDERPLHARLGWAFIEWIERYAADRLPTAGGVSATVVVTMSLGTLMGGLAAASLDTGGRISAGQARRLACEAGIIPAVLGGKSQVLDLGRTRRFHTGAQRIAKTLEQGGCTAEGCDWPPGLCHLHHPIPWSRGGGTDNDGLLLCPGHHARAHDPTYTTTHLPGGKVAFTRRT